MKEKLAVAASDLDITLASSAADPKQTLLNIGTYLLWFVGAIALVFLIWGGVQFITAGGDSGKVDNARKTILNAVIGIIIVILSLVILGWAKTIATS